MQKRFSTDGKMQIYLAKKKFNLPQKHGKLLNHLERAHEGFQTDNIAAFIAIWHGKNIPY